MDRQVSEGQCIGGQLGGRRGSFSTPHARSRLLNAHPTPPRRLKEAFTAAVEDLGGLQAARPKAVWERLHPSYPMLTLQVPAGGGLGSACLPGTAPLAACCTGWLGFEPSGKTPLLPLPRLQSCKW
jgi:hypothetical protein